MKSNRFLSLVASVILIISILLCAFTLFYVINSKDTLTKELRITINQLKKYKYPKSEVKDVTLDEAKLYITIAKYCEEHNDCKGDSGRDGQSPACLFTPSQCQGSNGTNGISPAKGIDYFDGLTPPCYFTFSQCQGYSPIKGVDYNDGVNGTNGKDGREIERQCNASANRMEWRYTGDETWHAEFNLAPGQTCPTEGQ